MSKSIHQPQDKLFRLSLEDKQVAQAFFQTHLPTALLEKIDTDTLLLEKHSFIDEAYKAVEADVVYQVQLAGQTAYLYLLCEQQTAVDANMAFRLLVYTIRLMEMHLRRYADSPLPLVYPLVVYAGDQVWDAALEIFPLFGAQEKLARHYLLKPYQLLDIQRISDEDLKRHHLFGLVEFALKHRKAQDFALLLENLFPWLQQIEIQQPKTGLFLGKIVLQYVCNGIEAEDIDLFAEKANHYLTGRLKGEAMTLAQKFEERGLQKGIQQGMQRGMQKGMQQGMQQSEVAFLTRLIQHRFGLLPDLYRQRIHQADLQTLRIWSEKVLDAPTLESIFDGG